MLQVERLSKHFRGPAGTVRALHDVSLSVAKGEFVSVQGPSGCGKTTLVLVAGGLLRPDEGSVMIEGQDVYRMPPEKRGPFCGAIRGFVFQQFHLIPYLSVLDNVSAPMIANAGPRAPGRAEELIRSFGLEHRAGHFPAQLSTGERQRVALARALLNEPGLVLADEPTGNLDSGNAETVLGTLRDFAARGGAVLLVTHDRRVAEYAQRTLHLDEGSLVNAP